MSAVIICFVFTLKIFCTDVQRLFIFYFNII